MTVLSPDLIEAAAMVLSLCKRHGVMVATAESCTGGLVAGTLTAIAGSSAVVERGFVTYSNQAKADMLSVPMSLIEHHGAVSTEVAEAMAEGALRHSQAQIAVATTGIAGPDGGSADKPVGLVHFAAARVGHPTLVERHVFSGDRDQIRHQATLTALGLMARIAAH